MPTRTRRPQPPHQPPPPMVDLPTTLAEAQVQLKRARAQNAYLHRALAQALKYSLALAYRAMGWYDPEGDALLFTDDQRLDAVLKRLLTLAHPDKWQQGQPTRVLAEELTKALNDARAGAPSSTLYAERHRHDA